MKFTFDQTTEWWNKQSSKRISAAVVIRKRGRVLMVKANYRDIWTFPGGVVDENESPLQAVVRETKEETGIVLDKDHLRLLGTSYRHAHRGRHDKIYYFFVHEIEVDETVDIVLQEEEIEAHEWVEVTGVAMRAGNLLDYETVQEVLMGNSKQAYWEWEHPADV